MATHATSKQRLRKKLAHSRFQQKDMITYFFQSCYPDIETITLKYIGIDSNS